MKRAKGQAKQSRTESMQLITTTKQLKTTMNELAKADFVTVDSEFIRESTFWPQLCLIQLASLEVECLIDPLAEGLDLEPFFDLMQEEGVLKVFHSARQDLEIIYHRGHGTIPAPLFDTQIAAMVLGFGDSVAYDQLVHHICGVKIDKASRFTDWRLRPLSEKQLVYALGDVTHLRDVYLYLAQELQKTGRAAWLREEMEILLTPSTYENPPQEAWKRIKARLHSGQERAILAKLAAWREMRAARYDIPRRRILRDETLVEISQQKPLNIKDLMRLRSMPKGEELHDFAPDLLEAVAEGLATPQAEEFAQKSYRRLSDTQMGAVDILKLLLKIVAQKNGVAAKMLASSGDIEKIVLQGQKADVAAMQGWRYELYGKQALAMLDGHLAIGFNGGMIDLFKPHEQEGNIL